MSSETTQPRKVKLTDRKRQAILDAAMLEFDANGFQATSMDQISARANVSKRTVYHHFNSKEELFEVIRRELLIQVEEIDYEYDPSASLQEQLETIADQQVELLCSDAFQAFARISIPISLRSSDTAKTMFEAFHASNKTVLNFIKCATKSKRLTVDDAKFAARQFMALLSTHVFWPQMIGGQRTPSKSQKRHVVRSAVAMFLSQYAKES